jgi:hypothetical protein
MKVGVNSAHNETILFLDGDLIGLTTDHVRSLIYPLIDGEAEMTVGIFDKGRKVTDFAQFLMPFLSGQRALKKRLLNDVGDIEDSRVWIEVTLTKYAQEHHIVIKEVELSGMSHMMKEEKMGLTKGLAARMKMYWEIAKTVGSGLKR